MPKFLFRKSKYQLRMSHIWEMPIYWNESLVAKSCLNLDIILCSRFKRMIFNIFLIYLIKYQFVKIYEYKKLGLYLISHIRMGSRRTCSLGRLRSNRLIFFSYIYLPVLITCVGHISSVL